MTHNQRMAFLHRKPIHPSQSALPMSASKHTVHTNAALYDSAAQFFRESFEAQEVDPDQLAVLTRGFRGLSAMTGSATSTETYHVASESSDYGVILRVLTAWLQRGDRLKELPHLREHLEALRRSVDAEIGTPQHPNAPEAPAPREPVGGAAVASPESSEYDWGALGLDDASEDERAQLTVLFRKGAAQRAKLLLEEGGTWSSAEVAEHLGISRQAVNQRRQRRDLIAARGGDKRSFAYPVWQFKEGEVLHGLGDVQRVFLADVTPIMRIQFFLQAHPDLGGQRPLDVLRQGDVNRVLELAGAFGHHSG